MRFQWHCLLLLLNLFITASTFAKDDGKVTRRYILGFGPTTFTNLNTSGVGTEFIGGYVWNMDPQFDLILAGDFGWSFKNSDMRFYVAQLKGRYLFDEEKNSSWYAGAGIGLGYAQNHVQPERPADPVKGATMSAAFGIKFFRKTSMPLSVEVEHLMFLQESDYGTPISTSFKVLVAFGSGDSKKQN